MSIKFNISNDIAQSGIDKLNKSKVNQQIIEYVAECFNIISTLYQSEIIQQEKVQKPRGRRRKINELTERKSNLSTKEQ